MIGQLVFALVLGLVAYYAYKFYGRIVANISLAKPVALDKGSRRARWRNVLLIALGQKKMFHRPIVALLHLCVYIAFLFTQIELLEIILDGLLGTHRIFAGALGVGYTLLINTIEVLSLLALVATLVFIVRRVVIKVGRFHTPEMVGWPTRDALYILLAEIVLVCSIFMMNGADGVLQEMLPMEYPQTGPLLVSAAFFPEGWSMQDARMLVFVERLGWWLHVLVVFGFLLYLPFSKHLHIFLAFVNTYFARLSPRGEMANMPAVQKEVESMLGLSDSNEEMTEEIPDFGAKDIGDLSIRDLLGAYTCTECGRCTDVCPAHITGKKLSPRKIMMDVRDRAEELGRHKRAHGPDSHDEKSLFGRISKEEIHACTSCNACVEACPVLINPLDIILELRRYEVLTEGGGPSDWVPMFTSLENSGAVWQMSVDRDAWAREGE